VPPLVQLAAVWVAVAGDIQLMLPANALMLRSGGAGSGWQLPPL
jgi:hypothetical protein